MATNVEVAIIIVILGSLNIAQLILYTVLRVDYLILLYTKIYSGYIEHPFPTGWTEEDKDVPR